MKHFLFLSIMFVFVLQSYSQSSDKPSGEISGGFFIDYFYNVSRDTGFNSLSNKVTEGEKDLHGLKIRRVFLIYNYKYNKKISSRIRLESDESNFTSNL